MTQSGQIKIGDFGIARVLQHTYDCAQTAIGTPYYLSPEICQEKPYNQKSDIWSLGCILYEMLTLRHAFDANSMKGLVLKILRGNYPSIPSTYSNDLKELVADMLIKDPVKRPSMRKILEKPFLAQRISKLLTMTIAKNEFSNTFVQRHLESPGGAEAASEKSRAVSKNRSQEEVKEGPAGSVAANSNEPDNATNVISKQKIVINKDAVKKKKKIEVMSGQNTNASHNIVNDSENSIVSNRNIFFMDVMDQRVQMIGNVETSDGPRKEIPQINEIGSQPRSKYFPS